MTGRQHELGRPSAHRSAGNLYYLFAVVGLLGLASVSIAVTAAVLMVRPELPASGSLWVRCTEFLMRFDLMALAVLAVLGLAGSTVFFALRTIVHQLRADRRVRSSLVYPTTVLVGDIAVTLIEDDRPKAFCMGYFRPRVYVSTGALDRLSGDEMEALVEHEQHHLARRDPLRILLGKAAVEGLFFLPLLPRLLRRYRALAELAADEAAVNRTGTQPMAGALLNFVGERHTPSTAVGIAPERIDHLGGQHPSWQCSSRWLTRWLAVSAAIFALVVVAALLVQGYVLSSKTLFAQVCLISMTVGPIVAGITLTLSARRAQRRIGASRR